MPTLRALPTAVCWSRLGAAYTAVLGFCHEDDVHVMPVNLCVWNEQVWFRTNEGVKLRAAREGVRMAVAVHQEAALEHGGWSVTARGPVTVTADGPPRVSGARTVRPWALDAREGQWVRIAVDAITGRELGHAPDPGWP